KILIRSNLHFFSVGGSSTSSFPSTDLSESWRLLIVIKWSLAQLDRLRSAVSVLEVGHGSMRSVSEWVNMS
ncbi:hypothetical protein PENTCL1PPCAC_22902, partial [Pristionchus entomophagus]